MIVDYYEEITAESSKLRKNSINGRRRHVNRGLDVLKEQFYVQN